MNGTTAAAAAAGGDAARGRRAGRAEPRPASPGGDDPRRERQPDRGQRALAVPVRQRLREPVAGGERPRELEQPRQQPL